MINIKIKRGLISVILLSLSAISFSACQQGQPKPTKSHTKRVVKNNPIPVKEIISAANLKLDSYQMRTPIINGESEAYSLNVNINNTDGASANISLENVGSKLLNIDSLSIANNDKNLFSFVSNCGKTIASASRDKTNKCNLKVTFHGKYKGRYTADIIVKSNSAGEYVGKTGIIHVVADSIDRLTGIFNPIQIPQELSDYKPMTKLNFRLKNQTKYAELKNNGIEDIMITSFDLAGDQKNFTHSNNCPKVLKVGESCEFKFKYLSTKKGMSLAYLNVKSNGILYPSNTIRLQGKTFVKITKQTPPAMKKVLKLAEKAPMNVEIAAVKISKNQVKFLEDFSGIRPTYFTRIMYQNLLDPKFKEYYSSMLEYYFKKNDFSRARTASRADKILNIYPTISIEKSPDGKYLKIIADMKVLIVTKANESKNNSDDTQALEFSVAYVVSDYVDQYFAYAVASDMINSFTFNLLGLED